MKVMDDSTRRRVVEEKEELANKINKLENFLLSDKPKKLSDNSIFLLSTQCLIMKVYLNILKRRLTLDDEIREGEINGKDCT